jgi:hypothetical protein
LIRQFQSLEASETEVSSGWKEPARSIPNLGTPVEFRVGMQRSQRREQQGGEECEGVCYGCSFRSYLFRQFQALEVRVP